MATRIQNARLVLRDRVVDGAVEMENGRVTAVYEGALPPPAPGVAIEDAGGLYLSPGFVDLHTHGAGGHDFMDGTPEAFVGAARMQLSHGATAVVPTTLTSTPDELYRSVDCFREARGLLAGNGPELLGMHLEGPYFSPAQRGAQDPRYIRLPDPAEYREILRRAHGAILRWSAAPELPGADEFGRCLREWGVYPSIGHTDAVYEDVARACACGYTHVTHLYSSMSTITRRGGFRVLGVVESAYLFPELYTEVIADGCHLPAELLKLVYRTRGADRICLVTDSMRAAGLGEGPSVLGSLRNGQPVVVEEGVAKMPDRSGFAGSVATCDRLVRVMYRLAGLPLWEAVAMMTAAPAASVGLKGKKGVLAAGADADFVLFDGEIRVSAAYVAGKRVYSAGR